MEKVEIDCIYCDGTGSQEIDTSTYSDTSPQSEFILCAECDGNGYTLETIEEL